MKAAQDKDFRQNYLSFLLVIGVYNSFSPLYMLFELFISIGLSFSSFGVYLALLAGLGILAVPFVIKDSGEFEMPTTDSIKDEFNEMKDN